MELSSTFRFGDKEHTFELQSISPKMMGFLQSSADWDTLQWSDLIAKIDGEDLSLHADQFLIAAAGMAARNFLVGGLSGASGAGKS